MRSNAERLLAEIYGEVPEPTSGEKMCHELIIDSGNYSEQQLKRDILGLARSAVLTQDEDAIKVVVEKWNRLYPDNQYNSVELLIEVEDEDEKSI